MNIICEECPASFTSVNDKEHHKLTEHNIYKGGQPVFYGTEKSFEKAKRISEWLMRNRKGCTGSDQLCEEWYRADFLKIQHYDGQAKGFIQDKPMTFELIHSRFSPDSLTRARQKVQEEAYTRIMNALKTQKKPNAEDVALLPSTYTQIKRRKREGAMTVLLGK